MPSLAPVLKPLNPYQGLKRRIPQPSRYVLRRFKASYLNPYQGLKHRLSDPTLNSGVRF